MPELPGEIYEVRKIIGKYLSIHDKIFRFSLRKIIPIPGIFKPTNYGQHIRELDSLVYELERITISKSNSAEAINLFRQCTTALRKTIQFMRNICGQLYNKSQGDSNGYTIERYRSDVDIYNGLRARYLLLESALNEYFSSDGD